MNDKKYVEGLRELRDLFEEWGYHGKLPAEEWKRTFMEKWLQSTEHKEILEEAIRREKERKNAPTF